MFVTDYSYMFWTDWGKYARIERADMNGNNRVVIISDGIVWPNGLTIDRPTQRIIWADASTEVSILEIKMFVYVQMFCAVEKCFFFLILKIL